MTRAPHPKVPGKRIQYDSIQLDCPWCGYIDPREKARLEKADSEGPDFSGELTIRMLLDRKGRLWCTDCAAYYLAQYDET